MTVKWPRLAHSGPGWGRRLANGQSGRAARHTGSVSGTGTGSVSGTGTGTGRTAACGESAGDTEHAESLRKQIPSRIHGRASQDDRPGPD